MWEQFADCVLDSQNTQKHKQVLGEHGAYMPGYCKQNKKLADSHQV